VPSYRLKYDLDDHFSNITTVVHKFLEAEKKLNYKLLELHRCASDNKNEMTCRKSVTKGKNFKRALFTPVEDPLVSLLCNLFQFVWNLNEFILLFKRLQCIWIRTFSERKWTELSI
jgi:hypothetical protein